MGSGAGALRFAEAEQAQLHGRRVEAKRQLLSRDTELRRGLDERECRAQELAQAKRAAQKEEHAEAMALQSELTREKRAAVEVAGEAPAAPVLMPAVATQMTATQVEAEASAAPAPMPSVETQVTAPLVEDETRAVPEPPVFAADDVVTPNKGLYSGKTCKVIKTKELRALQARAAGPLTQAKNKAEARCADAREAAAQARIKAEAEIAPLCHSEEAEAMVLQRTEETEAKLVQSLSAARTDVADAEADANSALGEGAVVSGQEDRAKGAAPQSSVVQQETLARVADHKRELLPVQKAAAQASLKESERALSDARSKLEQATQQVVQQIDSVGNIVGNAVVASPDEAAGPTCLTGAGRELQVRVSKRRRPLPQQGVVQREALTRVEGDAAGLTDGKLQQAQSMALEAQVEAKLGAEAEANAKSQTEAKKKAKTAAGMKKKAARQVKIAQVIETKAKAEIDAELKIMRVKQPQTAEETDMKIAVANDIVIEVTNKTAVKASGSKKATGSAAQSPDLVTPLRRVEEESDDSDDPPLRFPVGSKVMCKIGGDRSQDQGWRSGTVTGHWYRGGLAR